MLLLLQDSLGGNAKTYIIANVHPGSKCFGETLSTLHFAQRAKLIKNKVFFKKKKLSQSEILPLRIWRMMLFLILILTLFPYPFYFVMTGYYQWGHSGKCEAVTSWGEKTQGATSTCIGLSGRRLCERCCTRRTSTAIGYLDDSTFLIKTVLYKYFDLI